MSASAPAEREPGRRLLRAGILGLLVLAPLPFGSVQPWAVLAIELGAALLGAGALAVLAREPAALPRRAVPLLVAAAALVAVGLVQLVPLPDGVVAGLAAPTAELRREVARVLPGVRPPGVLSLAPAETADATLRLAAYGLIGLAAAVAFCSWRDRRRLAVALAALGAFQAVYGGAEYLSGHQHIFRYAKRYFLEEATGTFINRNHFAGFLALCLPFALILVLGRPRPRSSASEGWRRRIVRLAEPEGRLALFGALAAMTCWAGVLLSYSRGGLLCAALATLLVLPGLTRRRARLGALALVLLPLAWLLFVETRMPGERFGALAIEETTSRGRLPIWAATLELVARYPVLGSGLGSFEFAFPLFNARAQHVVYRHAHNDWLQSLAEGGLPALAAVLLLAAGPALALVRSLRRAPESRDGVWERAALASAAAVGAFSLADFGLRIPANAVGLAVVLGAWAAVRPPGGGPGIVRAGGAAPGRPRAPARVAALVALAGTLVFAVLAIDRYRVAASAGDAPAATRSTRMLDAPSAALESAADAGARRALDTLADDSLEPAERLRLYRERLRETEALLLRSIRSNPAQASVLSKLAAVRWELSPPAGDAQERPFRELIALSSRMAPRMSGVQERLGTLLLRMGLEDEALRYYGRALEQRPLLAREIVERLYEHGVAPAALLAALPSEGRLLHAVVLRYDGVEETRSYVDALERALPAGDPHALTALGDACLRLDDPARLLRALDGLASPGEPGREAERRLQRSRALAALGRPDEALVEARAAAGLETDPRLLIQVARLARRLGRADEAIAALEGALRIHALQGGPAGMRAYLYREIGEAERERGRPERAYDAYRRALELDPEEPVARRRLLEMDPAGAR